MGNSSDAKQPLEKGKEHLRVALVDSNSASSKLSLKVWTNVGARFSEMVIEYPLDAKGEYTEPIPCFDSSQVVLEFPVIACEDSCVAKISDA